MTLKDFVRDFCHFSRRDRIAIITLISLCVLVWVLPGVVFRRSHIGIKASDDVIASMDSIGVQSRELRVQSRELRVKSSELGVRNYTSENIHLFYFDPNKLDLNGWMQLGIREKTALTIQKYISKGGKFRKKEDLQKIWGLHADDYERIAPYVRIPEQQEFASSYYKTDTNDHPVYKKYTSSIAIIDINLADTTAFIALPGIGSKLASRIISFREKLGGFYSIDQVGETYGLQDSTFQKIKKWLKLDNSLLKKININKATVEELRSHPYIRWNLANAIINYRKEHGDFKSIEELKNIMIVTDEVYEKVKNYLIVE